ncbi:MAG TPA: DNA ligase [Rhodocyclaceae bacterium]|jgi:DNA ligase-1|nr:DNA ligase [Rhodocyclaceae bacterium]
MRLLARIVFGATLISSLSTFPLFSFAAEAAAPVMLANVYRGHIDLSGYWVSEKYDGVRGYWNGEQLLTRGGERIAAPAWFTQGLPQTALDGELWGGRGRFQETVATVRQQTPDDTAWRRIRFMVFDLPDTSGTFDERLNTLRILIPSLDMPWIQVVEQRKIADHKALDALLRKTVQAGGEGLMLHRGASLYRAERNDDLLKLKPYDDAEAKVIGYQPGKGKYAGRVGALLVETPDGKRFKLGTGLNDGQRASPPPLGAWVTYRFIGFNNSGIPRFATFLRVRADMNPTPVAQAL